MTISINTREAYAEVDSFIECLDSYDKNKVPESIRKYFKKEKSKNYNKIIDVNQPIKDQNLKDETLAIIAMLNLKYWCDDEEEKKILMTIYSENEKKYQNELKEKYDIEKIFKERNNKKSENYQEKNVPEIKKESLWDKLKNMILKMFKK
ncbi:MAG: hypothetical protein HXK68_03915 [Clostridiales bacterium]|nr:hypothetical protein [Clostridiales bacterium]